MNNYFYCIGFLYMLDLIRNIFMSKSTIVDVKETYDKMDIKELMNEAQTFQKNHKSNKLEYLIGFSFFCWFVVGFLSNTPEKYWFLFDMICVIIYLIFIFSIGIYLAFNAMFKKQDISDDTKIQKYSVAPSKIISSIELIIVSIILYLHFIN